MSPAELLPRIGIINVFRKTEDGIHHTYNTKMIYAGAAEGQHPRHVDSIWPLWNMFDPSTGRYEG